MNKSELGNIFTYHAPTMVQIERYARLRQKAKEFATLILEITPQSREQSLALTAVQETCMWANASIAIHEADADGR